MRIARTLRSLGSAPACLAAALAVSCAAAPPALQVTPTTVLVDDPIEILASGLKPSSEFAVRATTLDQRQRPWVAEARFVVAQDVFRHPGRPENLVEIPLEDGAAAVSWLDRRPETSRIAALGFSKGTELALTLASRDPRVEAVVAIAPSAYVWPGISEGPPEKRSSWTWEGKPLAHVPWAVGPRSGAMFAAGPPFHLRLLYEESLAAAPEETRSAAAIDIARVAGPVLLVSGEEDGSWPASEMAETLVERMTLAGRADEVTHLRYPGAGHLLFWDFLPATTSEGNPGQIFGGSPAATARARADS